MGDVNTFIRHEKCISEHGVEDIVSLVKHANVLTKPLFNIEWVEEYQYSSVSTTPSEITFKTLSGNTILHVPAISDKPWMRHKFKLDLLDLEKVEFTFIPYSYGSKDKVIYAVIYKLPDGRYFAGSFGAEQTKFALFPLGLVFGEKAVKVPHVNLISLLGDWVKYFGEYARHDFDVEKRYGLNKARNLPHYRLYCAIGLDPELSFIGYEIDAATAQSNIDSVLNSCKTENS